VVEAAQGRAEHVDVGGVAAGEKSHAAQTGSTSRRLLVVAAGSV